MKICFYNVTAGIHHGGFETYCWEVGRSILARGHQVTIVTGKGGFPRYREIEFEEFPFTERNRFPDFGTRFRKLMERCSFARKALPHLKDGPYDAVIINKPFDFPALWWARKRGMRTTNVFSSGGTDFFPGDRFFTSAIDFWVAASIYNARQIRERYGHPVQAIYNGVDTDLFTDRGHRPELRAQWSIPDQAPLIMSCGRLVGWKGLAVIVESISAIPSVHYVVIGDGPAKGRLQQLARDFHVSDRVHFLGMITHDRLPEFLSQADIFVQPSIGEEAFGISIIEAMACQRAVLASRNGGIVEVVLDGVTGFLLPPGDVGAWKEAIAGLQSKPGDLEAMGKEGHKRVVSEFTWAANAGKLEKLLLERKT